MIARRLLRWLSAALVIGGLLLLADAGVTLIWQEPVSAVVGAIGRSHIDKRFLSYRTAPLSPLDQRALKEIINDALGG